MDELKMKCAAFKKNITGPHQACLEKGKTIVRGILDYWHKESLDIFSITESSTETSFILFCNNVKILFRLEIPFSPPHESVAESKLAAYFLQEDETHKRILAEIKVLETIFDQIGNVNRSSLIKDCPKSFFGKLIRHFENHKELIKYE